MHEAWATACSAYKDCNRVPVQHFVRVRDVALVGGRGVKALHQARIGISADVSPYAEVPLVALLRLVHLGVACFVFVLCRQWRGDDGGVQPTRSLVGSSGSISASSRAHGTTCSISARNFSRRVTRFFCANS